LDLIFIDSVIIGHMSFPTVCFPDKLLFCEVNFFYYKIKECYHWSRQDAYSTSLHRRTWKQLKQNLIMN